MFLYKITTSYEKRGTVILYSGFHYYKYHVFSVVTPLYQEQSRDSLCDLWQKPSQDLGHKKIYKSKDLRDHTPWTKAHKVQYKQHFHK